MSFVLASGQFLGQYDNSYRFGYDSLSDDFSGSSFGGGANSFGALGNGFGSGVASGLASIRDPRQNRGKIKFNQMSFSDLIAASFHMEQLNFIFQ